MAAVDCDRLTSCLHDKKSDVEFARVIDASLVREQFWTVQEDYHYEEPFPVCIARAYKLRWWQRVFVFFEDARSCHLSNYYSILMLAVIMLNVGITIASTMLSNHYTPTTCDAPVCNNNPTYCPGYMICEPVLDEVYNQIDEACVVFFTIDYLARILTCAFVPTRLSFVAGLNWDLEESETALLERRDPREEPYYSWWWQLICYFFRPKNLIDFIAIIPFYISLAPGKNSNLAFVRILRLFRILRIFKMRASGGIVTIIAKTLMDSGEVLILLLFFAAMIVVIFGSLVFQLEQGVYQVNDQFPQPAYVRMNFDNNGLEESPFRSSLYGMYWAVITMTTVGYGDLVPTSLEGRCLAILCAFTGILFLALPISVLGNNFSLEYKEYFHFKKRQRRALLEEAAAKIARLQQEKLDEDLKLEQAEGSESSDSDSSIHEGRSGKSSVQEGRSGKIQNSTALTKDPSKHRRSSFQLLDSTEDILTSSLAAHYLEGGRTNWTSNAAWPGDRDGDSNVDDIPLSELSHRERDRHKKVADKASRERGQKLADKASHEPENLTESEKTQLLLELAAEYKKLSRRFSALNETCQSTLSFLSSAMDSEESSTADASKPSSKVSATAPPSSASLIGSGAAGSARMPTSSSPKRKEDEVDPETEFTLYGAKKK